jgi:hypothetical protein
MSWFAQTEEAQKHMEECEGCENCIWIEESAYAMSQYGTISEGKPHPLLDKIKEKFLGEKTS